MKALQKTVDLYLRLADPVLERQGTKGTEGSARHAAGFARRPPPGVHSAYRSASPARK